MGPDPDWGNRSPYGPFLSVLTEPVVVVDPDNWRFVDANEQALELLGVLGTGWSRPPTERLDSEVEPQTTASVLEAAQTETDQKAVWRVDTPGGTRTFDVSVASHTDDNGTVLFISLSPQQPADRVENRLAALSRATNELANATTVDEAGKTIVDIATEVLDRSFVAVWRYDEDEDVLVPTYRSDPVRAFDLDISELHLEPGSFGMDAFKKEESAVIDDYSGLEERSFEALPFESFVLCPIGDHGLLTVGSLETAAFDEPDQHLFEILADAARATFDRLERERERRELNQRLQAALENAPVVMFSLDTDGTFQWSGGAALSKLGLAPNEVVGGSIYDLYGDYEEVIEQFERALTGRIATYSVEVQGVVFETSYRPVTGPDGEVERVVGVATDVTSLKIRERQLANLNRAVSELFELDQPEEVYEFVVEAATSALDHPFAAVWTPDVEPEGLHAVAVSEAARSLADDAPGSLVHEVGSQMWDIYEAGDCRRIDELGPAETATGASIHSVVAVPLGEYGLLTIGHREPHAFADQDVELLETLGDLTTGALERLERERELHLMSTVIDRAAIGLAIIDLTEDDFPIIYVNEGFEEVTGYDAELVEGRSPEFLRGPDTDQYGIDELSEALKTGRPASQVLLNYRKDGTPFWNQVDLIPITDEDDTPTHALRFQRDVTDRVRREQQVQVLNRVLRHNLRTDMTVIKGFAQHLVEELDDHRGAYAETIMENADDLIGLSQKIRQSMQVLQDESTRTTGIREILSKTVTIHRDRFPGATIAVDVPDEELLVDGPVEIVVRELLENALLHAESPHPTVDIIVSHPEDDWFELRVIDDGPGIPESERKPLLTGEETPLSHASGFGLWLVQWTVVNLGGRFSISNRDPTGTVATVRLPLVEESTIPPDPAVPDAPDPG